MIFIKKIGNTYNQNFYVNDKKSNSVWVGKLSKTLVKKGSNFFDLNERATLANRLMEYLNIPTPVSKIVDSNSIKNLFDYNSEDYISDKVWLSIFSGVTLSEFLKTNSFKDVKNLDIIFDNIVFNLWIGNYDRKDQDILVDQNNNLTFIDYHLWGPGFKKNSDLCLGAYAEGYDISKVKDTGWCVGAPELLGYIKKIKPSLRRFNKTIEKINSIESNNISEMLRDLTFSDENGNDLENDNFLHHLLSRREKLVEALSLWIENHYPMGKRPLDPSKSDNIYENI
tara:strand:- start:1582 stop:2430 length:849 start_codon:yes stop_codon:yes gene_type:complete